MSMTQIVAILTLWIVALIPVGFSLVFLVLRKTGAIANPDTWSKPGLVYKTSWSLALGGFLSLIVGIPAGIGAGLAAAGMWVGVLKMRSSLVEVGPMEVASMHWDHMLLIVLCAPAIVTIATNVLIIYYGWDVSGERKTAP